MRKMVLQIIIAIIVLFVLGVVVFINTAPQFGATSKGESMNRIQNSPNYKDGRFQNLIPTTMSGENSPMWKNALKFMKNDKARTPDKVVETVKFDKEKFINSKEKMLVTWFGHSTLLMNLDGTIVITDPVFSKKASPVSFMGVEAFEYSHNYTVDDLPNIDVVLISHDHFDHLDYKSIIKLDSKARMFYVPLGVAAHLKHWGIADTKIVELDWWENKQVNENIDFISTPGRHFSGRKGVDKDKTLWCSWVIDVAGKKVFYCGDSGYGPHFKQIGAKYGPFEFTMMECGQYNEGWPYIHMMPEESVQAHIDLNGKMMLPIHWGKFKLSLHKWTEPIERATIEAKRLGVNLLRTKIGEIVEIADVESKIFENQKLTELVIK